MFLHSDSSGAKNRYFVGSGRRQDQVRPNSCASVRRERALTVLEEGDALRLGLLPRLVQGDEARTALRQKRTAQHQDRLKKGETFNDSTAQPAVRTGHAKCQLWTCCEHHPYPTTRIPAAPLSSCSPEGLVPNNVPRKDLCPVRHQKRDSHAVRTCEARTQHVVPSTQCMVPRTNPVRGTQYVPSAWYPVRTQCVVPSTYPVRGTQYVPSAWYPVRTQCVVLSMYPVEGLLPKRTQ